MGRPLRVEGDSRMRSRDSSERFELIRRYGSHSLAYSTLQPGLEYFDTEGGFLAYRRKGIPGMRFVVVLGDPVAQPRSVGGLIDAFLERFPDACFLPVGAPTAAILGISWPTLNRKIREYGIEVPSPAPCRARWRAPATTLVLW